MHVGYKQDQNHEINYYLNGLVFKYTPEKILNCSTTPLMGRSVTLLYCEVLCYALKCSVTLECSMTPL